PAERPAYRHAERRGDKPLRQRPRHGDSANCEQILEREMQADAEHQENDDALGELVGDILVGHKAGRERADDDSRHQISDKWRQLEAGGEHAKGEGEHEADRDGRYEWRHMQHSSALLASTLTMNGAADNPLARAHAI